MSDIVSDILAAIPKPAEPAKPATPAAIIVPGEPAAAPVSKSSESYGAEFQKRFGAPPAPTQPLTK